MSDHPPLSARVWPLVGAALVVLADQITKALVVAGVPVNSVAWAWGGDFFWLVHQRNTGVAFSLGNGLPEIVRHGLFILVPVVVLGFVAVYAWRDKTLTGWQRWALSLILGGGVGNIIDRIFRPDGVVDFLSFKFYGLFGMERFATFNVADSAVTIGGVLIVLSLLLSRKRR